MLIHLDQVDYAGHHEGGPMTHGGMQLQHRVDELLKEIASAMDLNQDTLLVVSDHGQIDRGGHGGQDPIVLLEPFVLVGKGVIPGKYGDIQMVDVAPTDCSDIGDEYPRYESRSPSIEMLDFSLAQVDKINTSIICSASATCYKHIKQQLGIQ